MKVTIDRDRGVAQEMLPENPPQATDLGGGSGFPRKPTRRRRKNSGRGFRLKRESIDQSARICSRPETPLVKWKFDDRIGVAKNEESVEGENSRDCARKIGRQIRPAVSARKLAAGIWRMRLSAFQDQRFGLQTGGRHSGEKIQCNLVNAGDASPVKDTTSSRHSVSDRNQGTHFKPSFQCPNSEMELKPTDHRSPAGAAVISALEMELEEAKARINQLETERRSANKKLKQFLEKVSEERAAWRSREHDKVRAIIDDMKAELSLEKKNRQRLEMVNSKLVNELANVKSSAKRYVQEYEKERKARELVEEVCDELAKEIREDKAEVEALKQEMMQVREEVEEERKMLQMAEIWREERVQMKLVDAKVMLEEKYSQISMLVADLDSFLSSTTQTADAGEVKKAQFLRQVAASVNIQDVRNLKYEPPNPDEIFSIFENVVGECHEKGGEEPSVGYSPASHASNIHTVSPEVKKVSRDNTELRRNGYVNQSGVIEDDTSEWETVTQPEDDQGSSYSPYGSDPSVGKDFRVSNSSRTGMIEWENNGGTETPVMEICDGLPASKLWKSCPINGDNYKIISIDGTAAARFPNGTTKGGKGCTEWQKGGGKVSLKAKLMDARMENRKMQLRQVLQQKM